METAYYQQSQTHPHLKTAKEKGFRARGPEDKDLVTVLETEYIA